MGAYCGGLPEGVLNILVVGHITVAIFLVKPLFFDTTTTSNSLFSKDMQFIVNLMVID